jgi:hypothetical protein
MLPSAFGYVEGWTFYGMSLLARTLAPGYLYRFNKNNTAAYESVLNHRLGTRVPPNRRILIFLWQKR